MRKCYARLVKVATGKIKILYKEVFVMNTKSMEQFKQMDVEMLASVDGG